MHLFIHSVRICWAILVCQAGILQGDTQSMFLTRAQDPNKQGCHQQTSSISRRGWAYKSMWEDRKPEGWVYIGECYEWRTQRLKTWVGWKGTPKPWAERALVKRTVRGLPVGCCTPKQDLPSLRGMASHWSVVSTGLRKQTEPLGWWLGVGDRARVEAGVLLRQDSCRDCKVSCGHNARPCMREHILKITLAMFCWFDISKNK